MNLIVNAAENWAIGNNNQLLVRIPSDMKFFQSETTGKVIVMGRKTLESLPGGRPLANRTNIVLTGNPDYEVKGAVVVHSLEALLEQLKQYKSEDVYIIGGAAIYELLLPYCDTAHVTKVQRAFDADTYFPNLDERQEWKLTGQSDEQTYFDLEYYFCKYERVKASE